MSLRIVIGQYCIAYRPLVVGVRCTSRGIIFFWWTQNLSLTPFFRCMGIFIDMDPKKIYAQKIIYNILTCAVTVLFAAYYFSSKVDVLDIQNRNYYKAFVITWCGTHFVAPLNRHKTFSLNFAVFFFVIVGSSCFLGLFIYLFLSYLLRLF